MNPLSSNSQTTSTDPRSNGSIDFIENTLHHKKNVYPKARHFVLVALVLVGVLLILFLMHQNGKSIYDNGV